MGLWIDRGFDPSPPRLRGRGADDRGLMAAASDEQEVLKARLLAKEASLRDLTKRYLQFVNGVEGKSAEECGVLYQGLLKEIARYEFAVSKARSLIETNTRQVADYDQMRQVSEPPHARALPRIPAQTIELPRTVQYRALGPQPRPHAGPSARTAPPPFVFPSLSCIKQLRCLLSSYSEFVFLPQDIQSAWSLA